MTASPKEILSESPDNFYHMGGVRKSAPPPPPIFIPPKINQVQANRELSPKIPSPPGPQLIGKRRASSDKGGAKKAIRTKAPAPTSASLAPLAIGKRKNGGGGGEEASKRVKTVAHRNVKGLKINVAGVGGIPTTGPLSASAKPKSMDQLPKRTPGRVAKAKVTIAKAPKAKVTKARK